MELGTDIQLGSKATVCGAEKPCGSFLEAWPCSKYRPPWLGRVPVEDISYASVQACFARPLFLILWVFKNKIIDALAILEEILWSDHPTVPSSSLLASQSR